MLALLAVVSMSRDELVRTPAIYRCTMEEGESKFLEPMVNDDGFDTYCIEPKPGPSALRVTKGKKVGFINGSVIDTKPNMLWRNATIAFANGKISPREWLKRTSGLKETVHFLSNPKTPKLRQATGRETRKAVFAEMFLLAWPGMPCLTSDDIGGTRYLPGPGPLESWILAMNDYMGPMLYLRNSSPFVVTGKPKIIRADDKPGMLIFQQRQGKNVITFYFNNGPSMLPLPKVDLQDAAGIMLGLNVEEPTPRLQTGGFFFTHTE